MSYLAADPRLAKSASSRRTSASAISIAVVGYGYWGPNLARCVTEADGCVLGAIADPLEASLTRAAKRHPFIPTSGDWRDIVSDPTIDAVIIATPVATHFDIALAMLKSGKHVLVEKPMAATSAEAGILLEEATRRNLVLMVDHTFIYSPAVQKIRELISSGCVGDVYYYDSTRINLGIIQRDVSVIWDLAVHDAAILDFLFEEKPIAVSASSAGHVSGKPESMAHITLFYPGSMVAHLNVNWLAPVKIRQTLIGGSRQMIVYDDLERSEKVKVYDRGVSLHANGSDVRDLLVSYRLGDMWAPQLSVKEALLAEVEHFVASIRAGLAPITSGAAGLRVVQIIERAELSLRRRGTPVEIGAVRRAS